MQVAGPSVVLDTNQPDASGSRSQRDRQRHAHRRTRR